MLVEIAVILGRHFDMPQAVFEDLELLLQHPGLELAVIELCD